MVFDAKVDWWFLALFYGLGAWMLIVAPWIRRRSRGAALLLAVCGLLFVAVAWSVDRVTFEITPGGHLDAHGWPWNGRITRLDAIRRIEPSHDPRASHAASLDRLRIDYGDDGLIFIAVIDRDGFLDAVAQASPVLERTGSGVRRIE